MAIKRKAVYIPLDSGSVFAWVHSATDAKYYDAIALICPPLGHEYMSSHRSLRHLADSLAKAGITAIRLDYVNTGNSSDRETESSFVENAVRNIADLSQRLKTRYQSTKVCCFGFGLGASFSMLAAERTAIDHLVLWAPCIKGSRYIREIKALSSMLPGDGNDTSIEAAGLVLNDTFESELNQFNLGNIKPKATNQVLYLHPSESKLNANLVKHLEQVVQGVKVNGYVGHEKIITYPTETEVPVAAIDLQINFITGLIKPSQELEQPHDIASHCEVMIDAKNYQEAPVYFAGGQQLFGIINQTKQDNKNQKVLVVFLNCGSEHHVGPQRIYTSFSRQLAALGINSFRMDIEGIGDSISQGNNQENYAYSPVVMQDITNALDYATQQGYQQFIFTGICAGAYHSFKAAAELDNYNILGAIPINPLVFHWVEKNAAAQSQNISNTSEIKRYKESLFSFDAWKKLFKKGKNILSLIKIISSFIFFRVKKLLSGLLSGESNPIEKNLSQYLKLDRRLNIILAESDPGYDLLVTDAKKTVDKAMKLDYLSVDAIKGADHGLSKQAMRIKCYEYFLQALKKMIDIPNK